MGAAQWFTFRYGSLSGPLLRLLGCGQKRSGIAIGGTQVAVEMGWAFSGRAPMSSVTSARESSDSVISRGVHGWRSDWLVNGAGDGLVEVRFDPPMRAHVVGVPVKVRRLRVSAEDPAGLVSALRAGSDD